MPALVGIWNIELGHHAVGKSKEAVIHVIGIRHEPHHCSGRIDADRDGSPGAPVGRAGRVEFRERAIESAHESVRHIAVV